MSRNPAQRLAPRPRRFLTRRAQAERYSKSVKTIERWGQDPRMAMPPEYDFRGLPHRDEADLEAWERSRVAPVRTREAPAD
jgi:hypothetical protein